MPDLEEIFQRKNIPKIIAWCNKEGGKDGKARLLIDLCEYGDFELLKEIDEKVGFEVNEEYYSKEMFIRFACMGGSPLVVEYLVEKFGIESNDKLFHTKDCIHFACKSGSIPMVEYLVEKQGVELNDELHYTGTIIHSACEGGSIPMVEYLVDKGIDLNAKTIVDTGALHIACEYKHWDLMEYLVKKGLDMYARSIYGSPAPIHVICINGDLKDVRDRLDKLNIDIEGRNFEDKNLLHLMCSTVSYGGTEIERHLDTIEYLIKSTNLNIYEKNAHRCSPIGCTAYWPHIGYRFDMIIESMYREAHEDDKPKVGRDASQANIPDTELSSLTNNPNDENKELLLELTGNDGSTS